MSLLAEAKTLVSQRYPLVFAVTLLGATVLIQSPRLAEFGALAQDARDNQEKSIKSSTTQASRTPRQRPRKRYPKRRLLRPNPSRTL